MDSPLDFESSNPSSILGKLNRISVFIFLFFSSERRKYIYLLDNLGCLFLFDNPPNFHAKSM